ncbi:succinyl-diaminopimelate desuccinylase [Novosphingobium sp. MMS21-SN21R]|uniref:succinyl-diaminopimelate desuccinylase n=1 Tax=Novosphingobium sp. MMS21-SN21R TaxID=2969298 RepID=UPI002887A76E|nr:succinyl-diaminopimelate desuccinylase [Novosphingobium sp. MMS21-SN21R]MDT0509224.1 succinyl-diaminopimelate desuccinylase [Novosphingobium sp. MMS21-SN21R]
MISLDPVTLAEQLIDCASVTPATGEVFDCLAAMLEPFGFTIHRFVAGEAPDGPVENMFAIRQGPEGSRHFAFAGHLDVVPPGEGWTSGPFKAERRGELLYGRGAVDMKGSIASMVAAVADIPAEAGTLSFIITGDEEGPARFGTVPLIELIRELKAEPDLCLVGEPTSAKRLGDMVKIGRRGSVNMWITCKGAQGHVAYPHLADNPIPRLIALLADLDALVLDGGTAWFQPSNLEITDLEVGNRATNVIPAEARARISIRFNDLHSGAALVKMVEDIARRHKGEVRAVISGESFITLPGAFSTIIADAVKAETGLDPELSTSGGTSDARFLRAVCPVVEFGLCNATMHKKDEAVAMEDLRVLQRIYTRIALSALS